MTKGLFCAILLFGVGTLQVYGLEFKDQLRAGSSLEFKHWNTQKKKSTGSTRIQLEAVIRDEKKMLLESSEYLKDNGKLFSQKKIWFDAVSGQLLHYEEQDFRNGMKIISRYETDMIYTTVEQYGKVKQFSLKMGKNTVPMEVLILYLQKNLPVLKEKKRLQFMLYLPALAFLLEANKLPVSLSQSEMLVKQEKALVQPTPSGEVSAIELLVTSNSPLFQALLPPSKIRFHVILMAEKPYTLLQFEEEETQNILTKNHF